MFGEFGRTPWDLQFQIGRIPCRVHPSFWLGALIFASPRAHLPANIVWTLFALRVLCLFVSILVHELGHALTIQWSGFPSEITLHMFGGYATYNPWRAVPTWQRVLILLAGPGAGFLLYGLTLLIHQPLLASIQNRGTQLVVADALHQLEWINLWWGIVNLLPVWPLDGGQITRAVLQARWGWYGVRQSLFISVIASGLTAVYFYHEYGGRIFATPVLLFGALCFESFQAWQGLSHRDRW